ncbi:MAG: 3-hydroxyacyl-CoA dehydrogenase [Propionibacteriaceae bacterium]
MRIAVIGAGAMGRGIAQVSTAGGHDVVLHDANTAALAGARDGVAAGLGSTVARGKLSSAAAELALARLHTAASMADIADADLVIEAIVEDLEIKQQVFVEIEGLVSPETVLASNTSSLVIGSIANGMKNRERLVGLHFFNPVPAMKLVEVVVRPESPRAQVDIATSFVESIGKTAIQVMDSPGFLVNLAGRAYVTEALAIVDENVATVDQVDRIARSVLGFPLGPFELMDLTGMDVNLPVTTNIFEANFADPQLRSTWYHRYLHEVGLLGRKTQGGFYRYAEQAPDAADCGGASEEVPTPHRGPGSTVLVAVDDDALAEKLIVAGIAVGASPDADLTIVSPLGLDVATHCTRAGLDPSRTVGVDAMFPSSNTLTLMVPPGVRDDHVSELADQLRATFTVEVVNDSPGFIAQRLVAAVVNLGCKIAQRGVAAPRDIDTAVKLGLRYPHGPLQWADLCGPSTIVDILNGQREATGDHRYVPSPWLVRRARTGLSVLVDDHTPARARVLRPLATA